MLKCQFLLVLAIVEVGISPIMFIKSLLTLFFSYFAFKHRCTFNTRKLDKIAYISLKLEGGAGLYPHIHIKSLGDREKILAPHIVTHGEWKVKQLLKWDDEYM